MTSLDAYLIFLLLASLYTLAGLCIVQVLLTYRTAQGAIAWIIALLAMPYVALPAYVIFGRSKFQGYVNARRIGDQELANISAALDNHAKPVICRPPGHSEELLVLTNLLRLPLTHSNRCELLIDGERSFEAMLLAIEKARKYILIEFYIVRHDELGNRFKDALIKKANEGLAVYFIYDEVGSSGLSRSFIKELAVAGINITSFGSTRAYLKRVQINFRNHRKIVVTDGDNAFIGGMNIGDEYLRKTNAAAPWRDTHLHILGPAVLGVQLAFVEDWYWAKGHVPALNWQPEPQEDNQKVLIIPTSAADEHDNCELFFLNSINNARDRIWIATPYFVPDMQIMSALQLASARGVDVRILIPQRPDLTLVYYAAYSYMVQADRYGIGIYRYQTGFMHQKVMLVDNRYASIGTANLDNRSMRLNFEITALVADKAFVGQVSSMLTDDFSASIRMSLNDYQNRSLRFRLLCRAARLLGPVL
ncbi:MAG: cardiolipin synthase [Hahellaceae bacterium]|jgi:cardiolipin synthase|nr:cardiolipin synthase [Hahellaceae bacterium]MCP5209783.1 cardiolipin synthase [Hahellaceae bacterium]